MCSFVQQAQNQITKVKAWIKLHEKFGNQKIKGEKYTIADQAFHLAFTGINRDFLPGASNTLVIEIANEYSSLKKEYKKDGENWDDLMRQLNACENFYSTYPSKKSVNTPIDFDKMAEIIELIDESFENEVSEERLKEMEMIARENVQF